MQIEHKKSSKKLIKTQVQWNSPEKKPKRTTGIKNILNILGERAFRNITT